MGKAKAMKAAGGKLTKSALCTALAEQVGVKNKVANALLGQIVEIGTAEVKKNGIFTLPGLARIKTRVKPATKACKKEIFGKMCEVKAKPAKTVVKAFRRVSAQETVLGLQLLKETWMQI